MKTAWTKPQDRGYLKLVGPDSIRFLNGQVTNKLDGRVAEKVIPACVCNVKGKVEALVWITRGESEDCLLIETEADRTEDVYNRLDRYLIADDCELEICSDIVTVTHIISRDIPEGEKECWRYGVKGYDIRDRDATGVVDGEELSETLVLETKLRNGIPEWGFEMTGQEFPADLGLDQWAVDFHKGCYLGQEIVSRIESVGKTKQKWKVFSTDQAFEKGHIFTGENGKESGRVLRDSIEDSEQVGWYLTSVMTKAEFEEKGFRG